MTYKQNINHFRMDFMCLVLSLRLREMNKTPSPMQRAHIKSFFFHMNSNIQIFFLLVFAIPQFAHFFLVLSLCLFMRKRKYFYYSNLCFYFCDNLFLFFLSCRGAFLFSVLSQFILFTQKNRTCLVYIRR